MSFKLNIPNTKHDTDTKGDYLSFPIGDLDKTFTQIIDEIPVDETGENGLTTTERAVLTGFVNTLCSQDNPDFDEAAYEADPEGYAVERYIPYIPTLREFTLAMQGTLGAKYHLVDDETQEFYVIELPPLEDSLVIAPGISERNLMYLFGRAKAKPNYTIWRWINNKEVKQYLTQVQTII